MLTVTPTRYSFHSGDDLHACVWCPVCCIVSDLLPMVLFPQHCPSHLGLEEITKMVQHSFIPSALVIVAMLCAKTNGADVVLSASECVTVFTIAETKDCDSIAGISSQDFII